MPNQGFGVQVQAANAFIGGAKVAEETACIDSCNLISGAINDKANVFLDIGSSNSVVFGNFIGTDITGTMPMAGNNGQGVADKGLNNTIGGPLGILVNGACTGDCNLISGNNLTSGFTTYGAGVLIDAGAVGTKVMGNFIGTDVTGAQAIGNGLSGRGVLSRSPTAVIGGAGLGRNIISGNMLNNVQIEGLVTTGAVQGNNIGTNSAGTQAFPSNGTGIFIGDANGVKIGGADPGAGNLISGAGTGAPGVSIYRSTNTIVQGNLIGTDANGVSPLPNGGGGVVLHNESSNNIIGGFALSAGNTIAYNENGSGVYVNGSSPPVRSNTIRHNSIHTNAGEGITLSGSGNDALSPPMITGANPLSGTACAECFVDIYSDNEDEGRIHEGSVFTDITGNWTFLGSLSGPNVTATNTDNSDNTSEFSEPFTIATPTPTPSPTPSASATPTATATVTPTPTPTPTSTVSASPSPGATYAWGDANCSGGVDPVDSLLTLREDAGLPVNTAGCPDFGTGVEVAVASLLVWGDFDCSGTIDPVDSLKLLRFDAGLSVAKPVDCPDAGDQVSIVSS
ncbi:MAG: right-handed parallel beta-helix repeat-containing protein [Dehalococcoidia bacterium]